MARLRIIANVMASERVYSADDIRALVEASVSLTSELSLDPVLQKVVEVAREQIGARYAALSVLNSDGEIGQFITSGVTEAQRQAIGHIPHGRGLLGVLLHEGASLRMEDIAADPRSVGFPANHPPMKSLLGVPVVAQGRILGNLYLTEKPGGFNERDEELLRLLSAHAAVAITNARLYEAERQRAGEWKALFNLSREVTFSANLNALLDSVIQRATGLLASDLGLILLLAPDVGTLRVAAERGAQLSLPTGLLEIPEGSIVQHVIDTGERAIVVDRRSDERMRGKPLPFLDQEGLRSSIEVPLKGKDRVLGIIIVGTREKTHYTEQQAELLETFANLTALAIETHELHDKLESLARLEERERIGMDLHDGVIQSIYAVSLHLEDIADRLPVASETLKPDVERAMDDLNKVIKDIRSYIFDLRPQLSRVDDLPQALSQLVEQFRVNTLTTINLEIARPFDGVGGEAEAMALFHIAQEALNNVSKHSKATSVFVRLDGSPVTLEIRDNGVGFDVPPEDRLGIKNGLRNMRDRARTAGADLLYESAPGKGTRICVRLSGRGKEKRG
jgi:two-component system, NarL family, sensor histidine kinase DevS